MNDKRRRGEEREREREREESAKLEANHLRCANLSSNATPPPCLLPPRLSRFISI